MKNKNTFILTIILVSLLFLITGCTSNITDPPIPDNGLFKGTIIIADGVETTQDCTPILTIHCEGAAYMRFSGDGEEWTNWIEYSPNYEGFNIANKSYGTIFGSGTKTVYIQFKDDEGNLSPSDDLAYDTVVYNMPELSKLEIDPSSAEVNVNGKKTFSVTGWSKSKEYEVPLDGEKVTWKACCDAKVNPIHALSTTYTAPTSPNTYHIDVYYEGKQKTAMIYVTK
ncbi:MAG: hypothetical protein U9O59_05535 [Actinomycetota bacterium]|nr:hypothetical protein [Actinomycetota bacterium]